MNVKRKIKKLWHYLYTNINRPEMGVLPGQLAFNFLMMIIPFLALTASILTNFEIGASVKDIMLEYLPSSIAQLIITISQQDSSTVSLWLIFIPALILASNGTYAIIISSNSIYKVKNSNYIFNRCKAAIMLLFMIFVFLVLIIVPALGNLLFKLIGNIITNESITNSIYYLMFTILKYPISFLLVYITVQILYIMAPNAKIKAKHTRFGAFFTASLWMISTYIYSIYLTNFDTYENFYGGFSTVLSLMFWLFILAYIFTLGMAINASRYTIDKEDRKSELETTK